MVVQPRPVPRPLEHQDPRARLDAFDAFADIALHIHEGGAVLGEVLELVAQSATTLVHTDIAWLAMVDPTRDAARPVVLVGFATQDLLGTSVPTERGVIGQALARRQTVVVEDYGTYEHPTSSAVRSIIAEEGIRSLVCCPLFRAGEAIGALYVGRRRPSTFAPEAVRLLEALAAQASVAIENHRLYAELREQNAALEGSLRVHSTFTEAVLEGVGIEGLVERLATFVHRPVRIETPTLAGAIEFVPAGTSRGDGTGRTTERIQAGGRTLGMLEIFHADPLSAIQVAAIEHARTVCALELVKLDFAAEVERRYSSRLLDELLDGYGDATSLAHRAERFGVDLDQAFRMIVVRVDLPPGHNESVDDIVHKAIRRELGRSRAQLLVTKRSGAVVVAVPSTLENACAPLVSSITDDLRRVGVRASLGIGPLDRDLPGGVRTASACASLGLRSAAGQSVRVIGYDDLGPLDFVLDAPSVEHTRAVVARTLEPLHRHDAANRMQLLPTLEAYLASDGHHGQTCERLFIGTTTLKYRLGRIEELLGLDLRDGAIRFRLRLTVELRGLLEAVPGDRAIGSD